MPTSPHLRWFAIPAAALLLVCIYLPTLTFPFDFVDDGNLVYPAPPMSAVQRVGLWWQKVEANFVDLGPFRPVLWAHWEIGADLLGADPFLWRLTRLMWNAVAAGMLLWMLRELGASPWAAFLAAAFAVASPGRSEVWLSLTLSEGAAMPYALFAIICAVRAARSPRPFLWDVAGAMSLLLALGCKNVFIALLPGMLLLRLFAGNSEPTTLRESLRRHGRGAVILSLTLLMPMIHYIVFRLTWHPGQYTTGQLSFVQFKQIVWVVCKGISLEFAGVGLALVVAAVCLTPGLATGLVRRHGVALLAGAVTLIAGVVVYLPLNGTSLRYCMPAVWGADILVALMLTALLEAPATWSRRVVWATLGVCFVAVLIANLARQDATQSRSVLLWQVVECVEQQCPAEGVAVWQVGPQMHEVEAVHVAWHVQARSRKDVSVVLRQPNGNTSTPPMIPKPKHEPTLLIARVDANPDSAWQSMKTFQIAYWFGLRRHECRIFTRDPALVTGAVNPPTPRRDS